MEGQRLKPRPKAPTPPTPALVEVPVEPHAAPVEPKAPTPLHRVVVEGTW